MPDEYISREAALKAANEWVSEACMAPVMRVSRLLDKLQKCPPPTLRRWCMGNGCEQMMTGIASQQFSAPFAAKSGALRRTMT